MKFKFVLTGLLLACTVAEAGDKPKPNYKVSRLSVQDVGISCLNGQPPEVHAVVPHTIVISCDAQ